MSNQTIARLYPRLRALCVFRELLETPLLTALSDFATTTQRIDAYSRFVSEIYKNGGNLASYIRKLTFENENVYVKALAAGQSIDPNIKASVARELEMLSAVAALTPADFTELIGETPVAGFSSEQIDLAAE